MNCAKCGGTMVGDGYTMVRHCENVEDITGMEADSGPIYCNYGEVEDENPCANCRCECDGIPCAIFDEADSI